MNASVNRLFLFYRWHWHFVAAIDESEANEWLDRNGGGSSSGFDHSDRTNMTRKRKATSPIEHTADVILPTDQLVRTAIVEPKRQPEFSSSVSFWWGRRILKPDS
jgi:hypothetical protein